MDKVGLTYWYVQVLALKASSAPYLMSALSNTSASSLPLAYLASVIACTVLNLSFGQLVGAFADAFTTDDSQLNTAYTSGLQKLTEPQQEVFLRAQIAWNIFSDKEKAVAEALQNKQLVPERFASSHSTAVVDARTKHILAFFVDYKVNYPPQDTPQNQDLELNKVYSSCLRLMDRDSQRLLIPTEEAWIAYRDADVAAVQVTGGSPKCLDAVIVHLTILRIAEFNSLIQALKQAPVTSAPVPELPPTVSPITPLNAEDAEAITDFQNDAKAALNALLEKKDSAFFKEAVALKNATDFPVETCKQISDLDERYSALLKKHFADTLLEPASNEYSAIDAMHSWSEFTQRLSNGYVYEAGLSMQRAVSQRPKEIVPDYLPVWQALARWHDLFVREEAKYHQHLDRGVALANQGKASVAIKEYQAAYDIIANPTLLENIKKLREQSLGL